MLKNIMRDFFGAECRSTDSLVSIGIPIYNQPESLEKTLNSITKQTYQNLEIIISDNHSPGPGKWSLRL